jgi:hypothetical protein
MECVDAGIVPSRSRSDLRSSDKRQLYTSVFMHYIVLQSCTWQYNFINAD